MDQQILDELQAISRFLRFAGLPGTAAELERATATNPLQISTRTWHEEFVGTYRGEVATSENFLGMPDIEHHRDMLATLDTAVLGAVQNRDAFVRFILASKPIVDAIGESHGNTRALYQSFVAGEPSQKHTYLSMALMYLILCEGVFKNQARLLLGLYQVGEAAGDGLSELRAPLSPRRMVARLEAAGMAACTSGYDKHIRNAIAHGYMKFDPVSGQMRFRDFNPASPTSATFDETWPMYRLASLYAKLDDTYLIVATYLQVHFVPLVLMRLGASA